MTKSAWEDDGGAGDEAAQALFRLGLRGRKTKAIQAVAAFIQTGALPGTETLDVLAAPELPSAEPITVGLSGSYAAEMLRAQDAGFRAEGDHGAAMLDRLRGSLAAELAAAVGGSRRAAHVGKLLAFATGLWALRSAQAHVAGAKIDTEAVVEAAARAVSMWPSEPYLRMEQGWTLLLLGRGDLAEKALEPVRDAPWLAPSDKGGWTKEVAGLLDQSKTAGVRLPPGSPAARLDYMCKHPEWLERAGDELPSLLRAEAGQAGRRALGVEAPGFTLELARLDVADEAAARRLIGMEADSAEAPTVVGLRKRVAELFGVVLPSVTMRDDPLLVAGDARLGFSGGQTLAVEPVDRVLPAHAVWWAGRTAAPPPMRALMRFAAGLLNEMAPSSPAASRAQEEGRRIMLADHMPYVALAAPLEALLRDKHGLTAAIAMLRLRLPPGLPPLWGDEGLHAPMLLDAGMERAFLAIMDGTGTLAAPPALYAALAASLRKAADRLAADSAGGTLALVVRDVALRPLMRALLQEAFVELPVLALAELTQAVPLPMLPVA